VFHTENILFIPIQIFPITKILSLAAATAIPQTQLMNAGEYRSPPVPINLCFKSKMIHSNLSHKWMHQGSKKILIKSKSD